MRLPKTKAGRLVSRQDMGAVTVPGTSGVPVARLSDRAPDTAQFNRYRQQATSGREAIPNLSAGHKVQTQAQNIRNQIPRFIEDGNLGLARGLAVAGEALEGAQKRRDGVAYIEATNQVSEIHNKAMLDARNARSEEAARRLTEAEREIQNVINALPNEEHRTRLEGRRGEYAARGGMLVARKADNEGVTSLKTRLQELNREFVYAQSVEDMARIRDEVAMLIQDGNQVYGDKLVPTLDFMDEHMYKPSEQKASALLKAQPELGARVLTGGMASDALIQKESGGDPGAINPHGYIGLKQFGGPRVHDLGVYKAGKGEVIADKKWYKQPKSRKWTGEFMIPGFELIKTEYDFRYGPVIDDKGNRDQSYAIAAQAKVDQLHQIKLNEEIASLGLDRFIGKRVEGVVLNRDGIKAMMHLKGARGASNALTHWEQKGSLPNISEFQDGNGTFILDYAKLANNNSLLRTLTPEAQYRLMGQLKAMGKKELTRITADAEKGYLDGNPYVWKQIGQQIGDTELVRQADIGIVQAKVAQSFVRSSLPKAHKDLKETINEFGPRPDWNPVQRAAVTSMEALVKNMDKELHANPSDFYMSRNLPLPSGRAFEMLNFDLVADENTTAEQKIDGLAQGVAQRATLVSEARSLHGLHGATPLLTEAEVATVKGMVDGLKGMEKFAYTRALSVAMGGNAPAVFRQIAGNEEHHKAIAHAGIMSGVNGYPETTARDIVLGSELLESKGNIALPTNASEEFQGLVGRLATPGQSQGEHYQAARALYAQATRGQNLEQEDKLDAWKTAINRAVGEHEINGEVAGGSDDYQGAQIVYPTNITRDKFNEFMAGLTPEKAAEIQIPPIDPTTRKEHEQSMPMQLDVLSKTYEAMDITDLGRTWPVRLGPNTYALSTTDPSEPGELNFLLSGSVVKEGDGYHPVTAERAMYIIDTDKIKGLR